MNGWEDSQGLKKILRWRCTVFIVAANRTKACKHLLKLGTFQLFVTKLEFLAKTDYREHYQALSLTIYIANFKAVKHTISGLSSFCELHIDAAHGMFVAASQKFWKVHSELTIRWINCRVAKHELNIINHQIV